mgnify:FL=1
MNSPDPKAPVALAYSPAGPVVKRFHESGAFVRGIRGPVGSGKSTACVLEILRRAQMQAPGPDGIRRTRWAIIRNSFPELRSTTIKTWNQWVPAAYGKMTWDSPIIHHLKAPGFDCEIMFMALDKPEDARKLLSLELTGAWVNEAREIERSIVDVLTTRVGRFPSMIQGGCTWRGIIMDTNPPDTESWWFKYAEQEVPEGWAFFSQPSGLAPDAENIKNLVNGYYQQIVGGKDPDWIKVYVHGEYGFLVEGQAVYPMFRDSTHTAPEAYEPMEGAPLMIGADFGLTPAAIVGQRAPDGRWLIIDEIVRENCGVVKFAEELAAYMGRTYPGRKVEGCFGDPAGAARAFSDERTALEIMAAHTPWRWRPAPTNELVMRLEVVKGALNRMVDGRPGFWLSPRCAVLRKGFAGGYCRKFVKATGNASIHDTPAKNEYSHPHDALQYLLLGGGEHHVVMDRVHRSLRGPRRAVADVDYPLFG